MGGGGIFLSFGEELNKLLFLLEQRQAALYCTGSWAQQLILRPRVAHRLVVNCRQTISGSGDWLTGSGLEQLMDAGKTNRNAADADCRGRNADTD